MVLRAPPADLLRLAIRVGQVAARRRNPLIRGCYFTVTAKMRSLRSRSRSGGLQPEQRDLHRGEDAPGRPPEPRSARHVDLRLAAPMQPRDIGLGEPPATPPDRARMRIVPWPPPASHHHEVARGVVAPSIVPDRAHLVLGWRAGRPSWRRLLLRQRV